MSTTHLTPARFSALRQRGLTPSGPRPRSPSLAADFVRARMRCEVIVKPHTETASSPQTAASLRCRASSHIRLQWIFHGHAVRIVVHSPCQLPMISRSPLSVRNCVAPGTSIRYYVGRVRMSACIFRRLRCHTVVVHRSLVVTDPAKLPWADFRAKVRPILVSRLFE